MMYGLVYSIENIIIIMFFVFVKFVFDFFVLYL